MNGEVAFEAKKIRLFYTPCFKRWNISHPTRWDNISFLPFASCDIDLYFFRSNILYVSLPPQERKEKVCILKTMALEVPFESAKIYVM